MYMTRNFVIYLNYIGVFAYDKSGFVADFWKSQALPVSQEMLVCEYLGRCRVDFLVSRFAYHETCLHSSQGIPLIGVSLTILYSTDN